MRNPRSQEELNKLPLVYQSINGLGTASDDEDGEEQD